MILISEFRDKDLFYRESDEGILISEFMDPEIRIISGLFARLTGFQNFISKKPRVFKSKISPEFRTQLQQTQC